MDRECEGAVVLFGAIVVHRLLHRMHSESCVCCSFNKQYKHLQIVRSSNSLQMDFFMRERELDIMCFLCNQQDMNCFLTL